MLGRQGRLRAPGSRPYCYKGFLLLGLTFPIERTGRKQGAVGIAFELLFGADELRSQISQTGPAGLTAGSWV